MNSKMCSHKIRKGFNPLYTNGFFFLVSYNTLGIIHCILLGVSGCDLKNKFCILLSEDIVTLTNSVVPDEWQHFAAFHLCLHCLQNNSFIRCMNTKG